MGGRDELANFSIKYGQSMGDRLILINARRDSKVVAGLERCGITQVPGQITIGYYRQLADPDGAWCFMPVDTPTAVAALSLRMVQARIAKDLSNRIKPRDGV